MIWLTWRQQRTEMYIGAAIFALMAFLLVKTGLDMASDYRNTGVGSCLGPHSNSDCYLVIGAFQSRFDSVVNLVGWLNFVPLLFGFVFAAPFVLELEQGTYRLSWTQSVTRTRWVATKLGVIALLTVITAAAFTALMTWWRIPYDHLQGSFAPNEGFDFEGTVPLAYALFAVALGIATGTIIRRIIPSMIVSIVGFLAVRLWIQGNLRPIYMTPFKLVSPMKSRAGIGRTDWVISSSWSDRAGHQLSDSAVFQMCPPNPAAPKAGVLSCFTQHNIFSVNIYQPASRFWTFQAIESGIFLGMTVILLGITIYWVRFRIA